MKVKVSDIISLMKEIAPENLAMDWDNVGLQVGDYKQQVDKVLIALDINEDVLEEAIKREAELIITHHPMIFNKLKNVTANTYKGRLIQKAIKKGISIYAAHTNYDIAEGGLNDLLAEKLKLKDIKVLKPLSSEVLKKVVVFVPQESVEQLKDAMADQKAGWIGDYSHCFFAQAGTGSFKPLAGTDPYSGEEGVINNLKEIRLETIVKEKDLNNVIKAMIAAHPYEEVAYDIYNLAKSGKANGIGRIGSLEKELSLKKYLTEFKDVMELSQLRLVTNSLQEKVNKVALCSGSGADYIELAARKGADLYVTGDIKYHQAQRAEQLGINLVDAGHYGSEKLMEQAVTNQLKQKVTQKQYQVEVLKSKINGNPFRIF